MAFGLTGSRKARVSGLLKKELTIFDTCCNPSLEDMGLTAANAATHFRAGARCVQQEQSHHQCSALDRVRQRKGHMSGTKMLPYPHTFFLQLSPSQQLCNFHTL